MSRESVIKDMCVVPVAGRDSMLLNLSGAHAPYFTRNVVLLTEQSGAVGVGETPGGEPIRKALEAVRECVLGQPAAKVKTVMRNMRSLWTRQDRHGRGRQTYDLRVGVHASAAVEAAMLDLLGKRLHVPVAELLGDGCARDTVPALSYLFYVGDCTATDLDYECSTKDANDWYALRNREAIDISSVVELARESAKKYGFSHFKLKGGVFDGAFEMQTIRAIKEALPNATVSIDPNGAWSLEQAVDYLENMESYPLYVEDPCGAQDGYSGREIMAEFRRRTNMRTATNMIATDFRELSHAIRAGAVDIPLADPHFWTMHGAVEVGRVCDMFDLVWGCHSNNHFDISLAMIAHTAAAVPGAITPVDTHWIWQEGRASLTKKPLTIASGQIELKKKPGLGIEIDMDRLEEAHALYAQMEHTERDDAFAMQYLLPNWRFDPKRPCMVRDKIQ